MGHHQIHRIQKKGKAMKDVNFEYYVLNYDHNKGEVYLFNIFRNIHVYEKTKEEVKKYLKDPEKYSREDSTGKKVFGFEAFCKELASIIMWQEWSRYEYEISAGAPFEKNPEKLEKWDCWMQCAPNIEMIAREVIYQYKNSK